MILCISLSPPVSWAQDCNDNGIEDADCNANGIPDDCDLAARRHEYGDEVFFPLGISGQSRRSTTVLGDFDGDGDVDIIAAHKAGSSLVTTNVTLVRLGDDGLFDAPVSIGHGSWPESLAAADFNLDGALDFAVAFAQDAAVKVFINGGTGTFLPRGHLDGGHGPALAAGDIDDDGAPDLVLLDGFTQTIVIFFNEGDGRFTESPAVDVPFRRPEEVTVADLNDDGLGDLLVRAGVLLIFFNAGGRDFLEPVSVFVRGRLFHADLDGDAVTDLVVDSELLFNRGDGTFEAPRPLDPPATVVEVADIDGDDDADILATTNRQEVAFYLNDGSGDFHRHFEIPFRRVPNTVRSVDLDADSDLDLLSFFWSSPEFSRRLRLESQVPIFADVNKNDTLDVCETDCNANGLPDDHEIATGASPDCNGNDVPDACDIAARFRLSPLPQTFLDATNVILADFDLDGYVDAVSQVKTGLMVPIPRGIASESRLVLSLNDGNGNLFDSFDLDLRENTLRALGSGDFDGDGDADLVTWDVAMGCFLFVRNEETSFRVVRRLPTGRIGVGPIRSSDFDGDGDVDLAVVERVDDTSRVLVLRNEGFIRFVQSGAVPDLGSPHVADIDGDGDVDLLGVREALPEVRPQEVVVYSNDGAGSFSPQQIITSGALLAVADLDADGDVDVVSANTDSIERSVWWNDGGARFTRVAIPDRPRWSRPSPFDADSDGDLDLAVSTSAGFAVLRLDAGGFAGPILIDGPRASPFLPADFDDDGRTDLLAPRDGFTLYLNETARPASPDVDRDGIPDECSPPVRFRRGDCDGDGRATQVNDAVFLLRYSFLGGPEPPCLAACDANGDGEVEGSTTDALRMLAHRFLAGPAPVTPFPDCGASPRPSDADLGCERPPEDCR